MSNKNQYWSSSCGRLCLIFRDRAQVEAIHHKGQCVDDTRHGLEYFHQGQQFDAYSDTLIREFLVSCGIENDGPDGVQAMTRQDLEMYLLWVAAGDLRDIYSIAEDY